MQKEIVDIYEKCKKTGVCYIRREWCKQFEEILIDLGFDAVPYMQRENCFCDDNMVLPCNCVLENLKEYSAYKITLTNIK